MKKIRMKIKQVNTGAIWDEDFNVDESLDAEEYARNLIRHFNKTLREGESPRELLGVAVLGRGTQEHRWTKTNAVTIMGRTGSHDTYKCEICGITGKRFGLGRDVSRDNQFKSDIYSNCTTSLKQLEKLKKRRQAQS